MLDEVRRTLRFLRKAWRAGLIPVRLGTMPVSEIRYWGETGWMENYMAGTDHNVYATPHYDMLVKHATAGVRFTDGAFSFFYQGIWPYRGLPYFHWQVSLRGLDHPRPDDWIISMGQRFLRLFDAIRRDGYHHRCLADRIAVFEDGRLWDGGHRLACLAALGWVEVAVVRMRPWRGGARRGAARHGLAGQGRARQG